MTSTYVAVVPAAGTGRRFGGEVPKQYLPLAGATVMEHSLRLLLAVERIERIVVVVHPSDQRWRELPVFNDARIITALGGDERCHSVQSGLVALRADPALAADSWVLVHDVARPCCPREDIERLLDQLARHPVGGLLATPVSDTLKRVDVSRQVEHTVDRSALWQALTPQLFRLHGLSDALAHCLGLQLLVTDEAQAMEAMGLAVQIVEGSKRNIKITRPEDLALAQFLLTQPR